MITANVLWFLVCNKYFDSAFWEDDLIRKITHDYYQATEESLPTADQLQLNLTRHPSPQRKQYETIMLMDLQVIEKNKLLKATDYRTLARLYNFLRTKRGIKGRKRRGLSEMYRNDLHGHVVDEENHLVEALEDIGSKIRNRRLKVMAAAVTENLIIEGPKNTQPGVASLNGSREPLQSEIASKPLEQDREKELASWEAKVFKEIKNFRFKETKKHRHEEMPWPKQIEQIRFRVRLINSWREFEKLERDNALKLREEAKLELEKFEQEQRDLEAKNQQENLESKNNILNQKNGFKSEQIQPNKSSKIETQNNFTRLKTDNQNANLETPNNRNQSKIKAETQEDEQTKSDSLQGLSEPGEHSATGVHNLGKLMNNIISPPQFGSPDQKKEIGIVGVSGTMANFAAKKEDSGETSGLPENLENLGGFNDSNLVGENLESKQKIEIILPVTKTKIEKTKDLEIKTGPKQENKVAKKFDRAANKIKLNTPIPEISDPTELIRNCVEAPLDQSLQKLRSLRVANNAKIFSIMNSVRSTIQKRWQRTRIFARPKENLEERLNPTDNFYNQTAGFTQQTDLLRDLFRLSAQEKEYLKYMEGQQKRLKQAEARAFQRDGHVGLVPEQNQQARRLKQTEIICQICTSGDYSDNNQIVFCSRCNVSVHQLCYGMAVVPKCDWVCQLCLEFEDRGKYMRCPLCTCRGGVMKPLAVLAQDGFFKGVDRGYYERFNYMERVVVRDLTVNNQGIMGESGATRLDCSVQDKRRDKDQKFNGQGINMLNSNAQENISHSNHNNFKNLENQNDLKKSDDGKKRSVNILQNNTQKNSFKSDLDTLKEFKMGENQTQKKSTIKDLNSKIVSEVAPIKEEKETTKILKNQHVTSAIKKLVEFSSFNPKPLNSPEEYDPRKIEELKEKLEPIEEESNQKDEKKVEIKKINEKSLTDHKNKSPQNKHNKIHEIQNQTPSNQKSKPTQTPQSQKNNIKATHQTPKLSKGKGNLATPLKATPYRNPNLYYNFYLESFVYPESEISMKEPTPKFAWIHMTCGLWMPEIFMENKQRIFKNKRPKPGEFLMTKKDLQNLNLEQQRIPRQILTKEDKELQKDLLSKINLGKYQLVGLKDLSKARFGHTCGLCFETRGATMQCYKEGCTRRFHIECAKRARLTLESQNSEHREYVIYCEAHTPLKFKKELEANCKKARSEVVKFAKTLKREIKNTFGIDTLNNIKKEIDACEIEIEEEELEAERQRERRLQLEAQQQRLANRRSRASKRVRPPRAPRPQRAPRPPRARKPQRAPRPTRKRLPKPKKVKKRQVRYTMMEKIACLSNDDRKLLNNIKKELGPSKDYFFVWDVNLASKPVGEGEENYIHETIRVNVPKKNIFNNRIIKNNSVWKRLSGSMKQSAKKLHEKHMKIVTYIKKLRFKPESEIIDPPPPVITFVQNKEELDEKIYCVCRKKWDGKLMVECEKCHCWYHPECIGIYEKDDIKLNMMYILCTGCRDTESPGPIANGHIENPIPVKGTEEILEEMRERPFAVLNSGEDVCGVISKEKWEREVGADVIDISSSAYKSKQVDGGGNIDIAQITSDGKPLKRLKTDNPQNKNNTTNQERGNEFEKVETSQIQILQNKNNNNTIQNPIPEPNVMKQAKLLTGPNMTSIIIQEDPTKANTNQTPGLTEKHKAKRLSTGELAVQQNQRVQELFEDNYNSPRDRKRLESVIARFKPKAQTETVSLGKRDYQGFCKKKKKCLKTGDV